MGRFLIYHSAVSPVAAAMPVSLSRVFLARRAHLPARHPPALGSNRMMSQCSWRRRLLVKHQRILAGSAHGSSCRLGDHRKPSTHFFFAGESCFKIGMIPKARSRRRDYYIWSVWCEADNDAYSNSKTEMNGCFPQGPVFATAGPLWPLLLVRVVRLGAKRAITHS
jgi:hypothetical protein